MEDVLDVYSGDHDDGTVLVCVDETSKQQTKETREPLPVRPGQPAGYDFEYARNGTANLFMIYAPLDGWRHVKVTDRRTRQDFARVLKDLADVHFPGKRIVLVMDNLNTHRLSTLYDTFDPAEASRLAREVRGSRHAEARQLAQHGRDRDQCLVSPVPGPPDPGSGNHGQRSRRMAGTPRRFCKTGQLAVPDRGRPHQAEVAVSINSMMS